MKEVIDKPIDKINFKIKKISDIQKVSKFSLKDGKTKVTIDIELDKKSIIFELKEHRKIDHKVLNLLRNEKNIEIS